MLSPSIQAQAVEIKTQFSQKIARAMKRQRMTHSELARLMRTSRAVTYRLLRPEDASITLTTMVRAAEVLGIKLRLRLA